MANPESNLLQFIGNMAKGCVSGCKKCSFFGKFDVFYFLETPFLRFALLPYYRRVYPKSCDTLFESSENPETGDWQQYLRMQKNLEWKMCSSRK